MKILLDESAPHEIRHWLWDHDVHTVAYRKWHGIRNGELIQRAAAEYDVLITADKNIPYQQRLEGLNLAVLVLPTNHAETLRERAADLRESLAACGAGRVEWMY